MSNYLYAGPPGSFKIEVIMDDLLAALAAYGVTPYVQGAPDGAQVSIEVPDGVPQTLLDAVIQAHDPAQPGRAEIAALERESAQAALSKTDMAAIRQAVAGASTVADLRAAALALADVVANMLVVTK